MTCDTCHRDTGDRVYIVEGILRTHVQCSYCHDGIDRPSEPELIQDSFRRPVAETDLLRIVDKLIGVDA